MADQQTQNLARALSLQRQAKLEPALDAYREILSEDPKNPTAHTGIGIILQQLGKLTTAEPHIRQAIESSTDKSISLGVLASNLLEQGRVEEACDAVNEACRLNPALPQLQSNRLLYSLYDTRLSTERRYAMHREWGQHAIKTDASFGTPRPRAAKCRLRIGYVSADFRNHPVATFLEPIFRHHDRTAFEVFSYSDLQNEDAVTARLKQLADQWVQTPDGGGGVMSDMQLASRIVQDDIDILVDLAGHTQDNRLAVFRERVASVQVSHIGYPCTTGLPTIGYRFSDALLDPPGADDALYSEKTFRLPAFWCYQPPDPCPEVGGLPCETGEGGAAFTFGSFNNLAKINGEVIAAWSRILLAVPGSRLLLKYKALHDAGVRERLATAFSRHGVEAGRIEMLAGSGVKEYMADFNRIDLGLDPFPFNGGTTTFNSFYMGVPVIALEGRGHAERMGAALLRHVRLDDFIAPTVDAYVDRAVAAAADRAKLAEIRRTLRERLVRSPLMDAEGYTHAYEAALRQMHAESVAAAPAETPRSVVAAPPKPLEIERIAGSSGPDAAEFSLIVAGRDAQRRASVARHLRTRFSDCRYEVLYVNDPPSLAAGYNGAIAQATGELVLLMHDDAEILNANAPQRIREHLQTYDLLGIAGTTRLVSGVWSHSGQPHIFGQVANPAAAPVTEGYTLCVFGGISAIAGGIQAIDGVFMAGRRDTFRKIPFDAETFDGFHLYDTDFSFRAYQAGLKIGVANDVHLFHASVGNYDGVWRDYHERFLQKFAGQLPPVPQAKVWFAQVYCRTREELREKMERNSSPSRGFTF